jgi:hypothetical protein
VFGHRDREEVMAAKIDAELLEELERFEVTEPKRDIPVIVTLNDWAKRKELEEKGLRVEHSFENISAVSGTLKPADVKDVAKLEQVVSIEFDGEVTAI